MADPKIKYDIEAAVTGEADAAKLAGALRNLGDVLEGDLKQSADGAAQALDALGSKQRALESFGALKKETQQLSTALESAANIVDRLGNELPQAAAQTQAFAAAEKSAATAVKEAQADLVRKRDALKAVREETTGAARRADEYKAAVEGLKAGIKTSTAEIKGQQDALRTSAQAAAQAQNAEAALRKEYELAIGAAAKLSGEVRNKNAVLSQSRDAMQAIGLSTNNLAQSESNLKAAVAQVRQEVAAMAPAYQQAAAASSVSTQKQAQDQRTLRDGMGEISAQLQRVQQIAMVAVGGGFLGGMIKDLAKTADEFKNLEARIKLATGEGALFDEAFKGVAAIALRTNSALDETGTLFTKLTQAGKEAGKSAQLAQTEALGLTETINQTIQLSGGAADSAKAAIVQLIQGLQSGVLRGEEFNSVMEQAPRLAQALATGLGVTTGELRKMANQGQLTADVVMKSLQGQAAVVATEFNKLPPTVGRALQNLSSQWTLYVGSADSGMLSSANAAKVIDGLAKNLDTLVNTLQIAGKLWAAMKIASLSADFGAWALKTVSATVAVEANTVAVGANTLVQRSNGAAIAASAAAQTASVAATAASTAAKTANAASWASIATFAGQATKATETATAATVAGGVAATAKASSLGLLGGALRGVTALLGGPVGLIATVVLFSGEIKSGAKAVFDWGMSFTEAGRQMKRYEDAQRTGIAAQIAATEAIKENAAAVARRNTLYEEAIAKSFQLSKEAGASIAKFDELRTKGDAAAEAINKIGKDFDLSSIPGVKNAGAVLDKLLADGKLTATEFEAAWAQALKGQDLAKFEVLARAAFSGAAREGERLAQVMDATLAEAVRRTGLNFDSLQGKIGETSRSALNDLDAIVGGLGKLKAQGVDTGRVLAASLNKAIDTADGQKAIDEVRSRIELLRGQLGDKVTDGLLDQARQKAELLGDAADKAKPGINSLREAMKELGVTSDATLKKTADTAKQAYDEMVKSGTASARELAAGFVDTAQKAIAANKGIAPSWVEAEAAARGYRVVVDATGRATLVAASKGAEGLGQLAGGWRTASEAVRAQEDALDKLMMKYTLSADYTERQIALLEREAAAAEKAAEAYRKKWNMDKEGYSLNTAGQRVNAGESQDTVDKDVARRYGEQNADNPDAQRARQLKVLLGMISKNGGLVSDPGSSKQIADMRSELQTLESKLLNGTDGTTGPAYIRPPAAPKNPATVVNLSYNGAGLGSVSTDSAGRSVLEQFMQALANDRSTAR